MALAAQHRLPAVYSDPYFVTAGVPKPSDAAPKSRSAAVSCRTLSLLVERIPMLWSGHALIDRMQAWRQHCERRC